MPHTWSWQLLRAGSFRLDGGGMFGVVPKPLWSKMVEPDDRNRIPLQTNCLLLRSHETGRPRTVLIETGFGDKWSDKDRDIFAIERRSIVDALREANTSPEEIDLVIVSHLHFDHAAGLTRFQQSDRSEFGGAGVPSAIFPTFPNARIVVQRREWEDALANRSTMTRTYLRDHLDPIADRVIHTDGETEIDDRLDGVPAGVSGIHVWPVPGHTWGQQAIRFHDGSGVVAFVGDVIPTANHVGLAFSIGYDMEPYTNMLTKKALLERAEREGWRLALDHEPGDAVVRVKKHSEKPGQFVLEPVK
jgi:glyoxylase-like metal-dependent hydrolase (beta-lactamase superfamily II)